MKRLFFTAFLGCFCFLACKETPKSTDTATAQSLADSTAKRALEAAAAPKTTPDSIIIHIDSMGKVTLGNRPVDLDDLPKILVDSCQFLKKTTGNIPKTITYKSSGAMMGIRGAVRDAIQEAQDSLKK
jgi:hypothetical protein